MTGESRPRGRLDQRSRASQRRARRRAHRLLLGDADATLLDELRAQVRGDAEAHAAYERGALALRLLEGDPEVAQAELDVVEQWISADLAREQAQARAAGGLRAWLQGLGVAALAAAAAALVWAGGTAQRPDSSDPFAVRGGPLEDVLGLDVLCVRPGAALDDRALQPASTGACGLDQSLTFAVRLPASATDHDVVLFGVDGRGKLHPYAPTPSEPGLIQGVPGAWTPSGFGVRIAVNHGAGLLRVFAIALPRGARAVGDRGGSASTVGRELDHGGGAAAPVDIATLERWAVALAPRPPAAPGDAPWHLVLAEPELAARCRDGAGEPTAPRCFSAEQTVLLRQALP
jgi:hypothetical protein